MIRNYQRLLKYGVAISSSAIALLLSLWLEALIYQFVGGFFYIAVIVNTWYGGFKPGIVTVVLSTLAIDYLFILPRYEFWINQPEKLLRLSIFLLVALVINLLTSNLQHSRQKIKQLSQKLAQEDAEQLRMALEERKQTQEKLEQQFEQQRLVMEISQRIRRSLNLPEILQTTVDEVRQFLECDRVIIFKFSPDWSGTVVVESVNANWTAILSTNIYDPCVGEEYVEPFKHGLVTAKSDIYNAGIGSCHLELLANFQVRANLVVPILNRDELWGLLIAHHCAEPREWQSSEIALLQQLGAQVSIAIQQAALFEQVQTELAERKQIEATLWQSERRYRSLVHASSQIVWRTDAEGSAMTIPEGWEELTGQSAAEYLGWGWFNVVHPDDRTHITQRLEESYINRTLYETEYRLCIKDGNYRDFAVRGVPILDSDGKINEWIGTCTDITERKKAQIALRQSEERYRTLFESIDEGFCIIEMLFDQNDRPFDYRFLEINPAFEKQTGLEQAAGKTACQLIPNLEDYWFEIFGQVALTGESISFERNSEVMNRWFDIYALRIEQPSSRKVAVVFKDITRRKQAQIDLQQLNAELEQRVQERTTQLKQTNARLLKTVVEQQQTQLTLLEQAQILELQAVITQNMAEGICLVRIDNGVIVYANPKFEQIFDYKSGELNGQHISIVNYVTESLIAEDINQSIWSAFLQNTEATYEVHNLKKDGTPFWCSATTSVFKHPDYGDVLVAVYQDITERKGIEAALRESEEKFRQLAENIQAVFWIKDICNQQILYVSNAYETIWQSSCENLYHNYSNWLDAIHPEDRQRVEIELIEQIRTGQWDKKYRIIRADGSIRWIRDRAFPIKNELGELVRIAGIAEDITQLQQIDLIKSEFIGIVSHELRTPLTAIRAALGLLQTGIYDKKPDKFKRMIEIAAIDSDRLVRLVNDILDLERLESGRAVLEKTTCNPADLIQQAVAGVQAIANQQNITFNIHPTNAQVWAAADTIIQTLTNLLGNAIKFSPADSTITLSVKQQTDRVLFQITDQGRGIPADKLEAIFGRFQQVDASDSRTKGGTGLGLAICRSIIDQHGGQIWAESTVSVGSTFFFTLPLPPEEMK